MVNWLKKSQHKIQCLITLILKKKNIRLSPQILSNKTIRYCNDLISITSSRNSYPFVWCRISDRSVRRSLFRRKYNVLCKSGAVCRSRDKTANRVSRVVQAAIFIRGTLNNSSVTFMNFIDAGILFFIGAGFLEWQLSDRDRVWICLSSFILSTILYFLLRLFLCFPPSCSRYLRHNVLLKW